ncbi:MAG TPA: SDR family NAD(P)-dependent oxidoreductase [Candidatus Limnocylindrales bacterium]|nr:SDR family NAD(P)-dependent oxidoreductase [Candidatus Limnocylindrales bacterium]
MAPERRLAGKRAVITGGTSGIGRATALRFLDEGASVVVGGRSAERGEALVAELGTDESSRLHVRQADVARSSEVDALVEFAIDRLGGLDILVASAGIFERGTATETDDALWQRVLDVDLSGAFYLARAGLPTMLGQGSGSIILTASELGLVGTRASVAYCAAKGGVVNLTRALAVDCAGTGVRVNCLCPGPIDTPLLDHGFAQSADREAERAAQTAALLVGRIGRPTEVAAAAAFLASDESSFMTGSVTVVDGGATAWYGF